MFNINSSKLREIPLNSTSIVLKADSGASKNFIRSSDAHILQNITLTPKGPIVALPDMSILKAEHQGSLPINGLSTNAKNAHILPGLKSTSLLSLGQICDDNCQVHLTKHNITILKNNQKIIEGYRNITDGLWDIVIPTKQTCAKPPPISENKNKLNVIINKATTKENLIKFLHAACFSPSPSTFIKAINNGNFDSWPGLHPQLIKKYLPQSEATLKGHMKLEKQGLQSTKTDNQSFDICTTDNTPEQEQKCNDYIFKIVSLENPGKAYGDLTGAFPYTSARGNKYFLVVYCYDANAILVQLLKNRTANEIKKGYTNIIDILHKAGCQPNTFILDNEISKTLTNAFESNNINYQLVPPRNKRRNAAERAIQTWKDHFLAGLASVDPKFPIAEWDRLVLQGVLTLNLLRNARSNPKLSAWAYLFGPFNYNKTPLAPPGIKIMIHNKVEKRDSWGMRSSEGFYVGPALSHYRCITGFKSDTKREVVTDTVSFLPHKIPVPSMGLNDYLHQALDDILELLKNPPSNLPSIAAGCTTKQAVRDIAEILKQTITIPISNHPSAVYSKHPEPIKTPNKKVSWKNPLTVVLPKPKHSPTVDTHTPDLAKIPTQPVLQPIAPPRVPLQKVDIAQFETPKSQPTKPPTQQVLNSTTPQRVSLRPVGTPRLTQTRNYTPFRRLATNFIQYMATSTDTNARRPLQLYKTIDYIHHIFNEDTGKKESIDSLRQGKHKAIWEAALSREWGRLALGTLENPTGTDTIEFIYQTEVPGDRDVTYASFVCDYRPLKDDPYRVRIVVGGDKLTYNDNAASPAASLLETKIILNSTISDAKKGARFITADIKDYFLATPMHRPEYMKVLLKYFPADIVKKYDLLKKVSKDGYVYIRIKKGMYGLKQAAKLAFDQLVQKLKPFGYSPAPNTSGIWVHDTRPTRFCLCVDDFGIKSFSQKDTDHLLNALQSSYKISVDLTGSNYCGLRLDWNYEKGFIDISMPGYIKKLLHKLQHVTRKQPQYAPHQWTLPAYGKKRQFAKVAPQLPTLNKKETKRVQMIVGSLLYYSRAVDPTLLPAINEIAAVQSKPTSDTIKRCQMVLDYVATYPNTIQRFFRSDMILHVDSDAAYLVQPGAKSRVAGSYILSSKPKSYSQTITRHSNAPILVECRTLRHVVASAAEAETGALFHNAQNIIAIRHVLNVLGHPQPPTPLKTDNSTAYGYVHNDIKIKKSKSWDMRYHWLRDRERQNSLHIFWHPGSENDADYFTKHFPPKYHREIRPRYVLNALQHLPTIVRTACEGVLRPRYLSLMRSSHNGN